MCDVLACRVKKSMSTYRTVLFVVLWFTCGWFWSDRPACGLSTTIHPFRLFNVLGAQPARVSQLCTSVFACDGCPSISKSSGMIVHDTVVIIRHSAWVDGIWGHFGELRADSWTIEKIIIYLKWREVARRQQNCLLQSFEQVKKNKINSDFQIEKAFSDKLSLGIYDNGQSFNFLNVPYFLFNIINFNV